jgi:hypothetical protein
MYGKGSEGSTVCGGLIFLKVSSPASIALREYHLQVTQNYRHVALLSA